MFFQIWLWISRIFSNFTKENGLLMIDIRDMTWLICGYYNVHFLSFSLCFSRAFQILLCRIFLPMVYPPSPYAENCFVWNKFRKYPPLQNVCYYDPQYFAPNGVKIDQKGCKWTKKGWKVLTIVFFGPKIPVSLVKTIVEWGVPPPSLCRKNPQNSIWKAPKRDGVDILNKIIILSDPIRNILRGSNDVLHFLWMEWGGTILAKFDKW